MSPLFQQNRLHFVEGLNLSRQPYWKWILRLKVKNLEDFAQGDVNYYGRSISGWSGENLHQGWRVQVWIAHWEMYGWK